MRPSLLICLVSALAACVEVPERSMSATPDAAPDLAIDAGFEAMPDAVADGAPCAPGQPCDTPDSGTCDDLIDDGSAELCAPCAVPGGVGACAEGRQICAGGRIVCAAVGAPPAAGCDLIDGDCDGDWDEFGEVPIGPDVRVLEACGDVMPLWGPAESSGGCGPGEVGCGPAHACQDRLCIDECLEDAGLLIARCAEGCGGTAACRATCAAEAAILRRDCIVACPAESNVDRWTCALAENGPSCEVSACAPGSQRVGDRCERFEICNNGVDDEGDGLVDGIVDGPDPCAAHFVDLPQAPIGSCPRGTPGCDGLPGNPLNGCGGSCPYAPELTYGYAFDREEVSNRAYFSCVDAGECSPPSGIAWQQASVLLGLGVAPERPTEPECADPIRLDPREGAEIDPRVVDLPVTGVSWCQARDYCLWAGKRLPTEIEWERAASGTSPRRLNPWDGGPVAGCISAQCCDDGDIETPRDPTCAFGPLPLCPEGEPRDAARSACIATVGVSRELCTNPATSCPECLPGPAVVYANPDGATPEGVVNLIGNASEWTFDWASLDYDGAIAFDPVGPPCSPVPGPAYRMIRGGDFLWAGEAGNALSRQAFPPGGRFPGTGFRCARTLDPDGLPVICDPGPLGAPARPPSGRPQCHAPDFEDAQMPNFPDNQPTCPVPGVRIPTRDCSEGQDRLCATDTAIGCGAFTVRRLAFEQAALDDFLARLQPFIPVFDVPIIEPTIADFVSRLFDGDLQPNGGGTLLALETECGFGGNGLWETRLVNGIIGPNGELREMGLIEGDQCAPLDNPRFNVTTQDNGVIDNLCVRGRGEFHIAGVGARIPYSALMIFDTQLREDIDLGGRLFHIITRGDAADSTLGDDRDGAIRSFLDGLLTPTLDLCQLSALAPLLDPRIDPDGDPPNPALEAIIGRWRCDSFADWPGCIGPVCSDPDQCTGWILPLRYETSRTGSLAIDHCTCDPP